MRKTGLVVVGRNAELLERHLEGHLAFTPMRDLSILVVPSATARAGEAVEEALRRFRAKSPPSMAPEIRQVPNAGLVYRGNLLHAGAVDAVRGHGCSLLLFADEATVVTPGWRETMEEDLERIGDSAGARIGLLCARTGETQEEVLPLPPFPWPRVGCDFAAVPAGAYLDAGGFDPELPSDFGADDALSLRLLRKGYHNYFSRATVMRRGGPTSARSEAAAWWANARREDARRGSRWFGEHYPEREEVVRRELEWLGLRGGPAGAFPGLPAA